jgi:hypothetical protein
MIKKKASKLMWVLTIFCFVLGAYIYIYIIVFILVFDHFPFDFLAYSVFFSIPEYLIKQPINYIYEREREREREREEKEVQGAMKRSTMEFWKVAKDGAGNDMVYLDT